MLCITVFRIKLVVFNHHSVSCNFCNNAGCHYLSKLCIAFYFCPAKTFYRRNFISVCNAFNILSVINRSIKVICFYPVIKFHHCHIKSIFHSKHACLENIDFINCIVIYNSESPQSLFFNDKFCCFTFFFRKLF